MVLVWECKDSGMMGEFLGYWECLDMGFRAGSDGDGVGSIQEGRVYVQMSISHCMNICGKPIDAPEKFNEYMTLEEQGKLLKLPCKVGDTVYVIPSRVMQDINIVNGRAENNRIYEQIVNRIEMGNRGYVLYKSIIFCIKKCVKQMSNVC